VKAATANEKLPPNFGAPQVEHVPPQPTVHGRKASLDKVRTDVAAV
jgi:hypothetical protein